MTCLLWLVLTSAVSCLGLGTPGIELRLRSAIAVCDGDVGFGGGTEQMVCMVVSTAKIQGRPQPVKSAIQRIVELRSGRCSTILEQPDENMCRMRVSHPPETALPDSLLLV